MFYPDFSRHRRPRNLRLSGRSAVASPSRRRASGSDFSINCLRIVTIFLALTMAARAGIISFTATPRTFLPGQEVTLAWSVTPGDQISINQGIGTVSGATGSVTVIPDGTTSYTLTDTTSNTTKLAVAIAFAPPQLVNRWSFNEGSGTGVNDSAGGTTGAAIRGSGFSRSATQVTLPGGSSATAPYIDLPNGLISSRSEVTIEGWMTLNGPQNWQRYFDFGSPAGSGGEIHGIGGNFSGYEYVTLTAQSGGDTSQRRFSMKQDGTENSADIADTTSYGTEFHFAVVYDAVGNDGQPQLRYYKDGMLKGALNTAFRLQNINDVNNWLGRSNFANDANTQGSYNEFRIWSGPLAASAIAANTASGPDDPMSAPRIVSFTAFPALTIPQGSSIRLSYLLVNPTGNGALTASIDQGVGALSGNSGYVTVTPDLTTTYTLTAANAAGPGTAQITVNVLPSAPVAEDFAITAPYNTSTAFTLVATDPNTPVGSLGYSIVNPPVHGVVTGSGASRTYTPTNGYSGPDSFTYKANDGELDSNIATVSITVNLAPIAPTDLKLSAGTLFSDYVGGSFAGRFTATDANPDDRFTYMLVGGAGSTHNALFSINGNQLLAAGALSGNLGQTLSVRIRVTDLAGFQYEKILTLPVAARQRHVQINELNYNSARNTLRTEYVELYNPLAVSMDLSGWRLSQAVEFIFPPGSIIAAGRYLVIAQDPATMLDLYGVTALGPWTKNLSSEGDDVRLLDSAGTTVDRVEYGITAPWPALANGKGPSLELVNPAFDSNLGGNWRSSTVPPNVVTYLAAGSPWSYRKGTSEASSPIGAWRAVGFSQNTSWLAGTAPIGVFKHNSDFSSATSAETGVTLGTQLTDMATFNGSFITNYRSVFFRKTFNITGAIPRALLLRVMHNDAAIVWINGFEVARFGFAPDSPSDPAYNYSDYYERGNDPWSETVLVKPAAFLNAGTNVIAIQGFAKPPVPRSAQEDYGVYNVFDFCVDAELKHVPELTGTPGVQNSVFSATNPPAVRNIAVTPALPKSSQPVTVRARISDPQGIGIVTLNYQVVAPGNYIPATLPRTNAQILADPSQPLPENPAFESAGNWTSIAMTDDGSVAGDTPGDGVFTATVPAQPHRTLVRFRITAQDLTGLQVRVPDTDDPRRNFAFFVYNGVPAYTTGGQSFDPDTLRTLPVYQWLTRSSDYGSLLAYNGSEQFNNSVALKDLLARRYENFIGTLVVDHQVIDHTRIRLRGGNSRYMGSGKRHFTFKFPKGTPLYAGDEIGTPYRMPWDDMLFNKMFGNKGNNDWGLTYEIGAKLWALQGVPTPESHWVHFRVVQNANESHSTLGDFWGMYHALEYPDGKNFLEARDMPKGNFYKMSDWIQSGEMNERYQVNGSVDFGEDFDNIRYNIHQTTSVADMIKYVNMPLWNRYNALQEAMRHYDVFVEPTGRHRVKNLIWWFEPEAGNPLGRCLFMPYDWDATFGPTWNNGWDFVHNALYDHSEITDSPTWQLPKVNRNPQRLELRNAIRELRDLVWYRDGSGRGPFDDIADEAYARIAAFWPAEYARWPNPGAQANNPGGAPWKLQDMKNFAFNGWNDTVGGDPSVGAGGRAAYLDSISDNLDAGQLPNTPAISYGGAEGYPVDGVALISSTFSDPQPGTFAAMQWRIGEVTDANAPAFNPAAPLIFEVSPVWESGTLSTFAASITVPGTALRIGRTYRARVRHMDTTGRWSHWSAPIQFTTTGSDYVQVLRENLMITEFMYHPAPPSGRFIEGDYEFIELQNVSPSLTLDLVNVRFTKGVDFDFAGSAVTSLAPGARVLVVKNVAAFEQRYGSGMPIAGAWDPTDNLSNSGEQLKLSYGAGDAIHDFTYDDAAPWPTQADAGGYSLVLLNPAARPDHALPANWRAAYDFAGSPGGTDTAIYAEWAAANDGANALSDIDFDGLTNLMEYALGGTNTTHDIARLPIGAVQNLPVGGGSANYLTISFRRNIRAEDIAYQVLFAPNASGLWSESGVLVSSAYHGDNTVTEVWRAPLPMTAARYFGCLQVTRP